MFKRIDHIEIIASDIDETIDFYTEVLNFKIKQRNKMKNPPLEEIAYLTINDTMIELMSIKDPETFRKDVWQIGYRMVALEVDDMEQTLSYLKQKGVKPTWGPIDLGNSIRAEIEDPDGLPIELRYWK